MDTKEFGIEFEELVDKNCYFINRKDDWETRLVGQVILAGQPMFYWECPLSLPLIEAILTAWKEFYKEPN